MSKKKEPESLIGAARIYELSPVRTYEQRRLALRKKVRMFYDLQRLREQCASRTRKKAKGADVQLHEMDQVILENRAAEFHRLEKLAFKDVENDLKQMPVWTELLSQRPRFHGVGPTMAGVIVSECDIRRQDTPSKMWAFAGLAPVNALRCATCHVVVNEKIDPRTGEVTYTHVWNLSKTSCKGPTRVYQSGQARRFKKGEKAPYNKFLKAKLLGVLGTILIRKKSPWADVYYDYKHRKESSGWGVSKDHRHKAAIRYMIKMLLLDIWRDWRALEGLEVRGSYHEEKQGHLHAS